MGDARKENRFRRIIVGQDTMFDLLSRIGPLDSRPEPKYWLTFEGFPALPHGAELDAVHYDHSSRGFSLLVCSAEFSPVPFGQEIPILERGLERRAIATAALPVSLHPVVKTWEGQNAKDAPQAGKLRSELLPPEIRELARRYGAGETLSAVELDSLRKHCDNVSLPLVLGELDRQWGPESAQAQDAIARTAEEMGKTAAALAKPGPSNAWIARQLVEDHRDEILGVVRPMAEAAAMLGVPQPEGIEASRQAVEEAARSGEFWGRFWTPDEINNAEFGISRREAAAPVEAGQMVATLADGSGRVYSPETKCRDTGEVDIFDATGDSVKYLGRSKSDARLSLEYDLRQAMKIADGSTLDIAVRKCPDADLEVIHRIMGNGTPAYRVEKMILNTLDL